MVKRVQFRFWLIAMISMGFCVISLITVINIIHMIQRDQEITRVLDEMVSTVEAVRSAQTQEESQEPEWRVESYVEEEAEPTQSQAAESEESQSALSDVQAEDNWQAYPREKARKGHIWWYDDFTQTAQVSAEEPAPSVTAETEETVINHYYYYYPIESDAEPDLRDSAMNQYAGRLCVVSFSEDADPVVSMSDSSVLDEAGAAVLASRMLDSGTESGDLEQYRFQILQNDAGTRVYFLDCTTEYRAQRSLLLISVLVGLAGLLVTGLFVYLMSIRAIAPLKESMALQKRFITDAGHELKTPLAVIGANMDILEMDIGKNEWVGGTKKQLARLRKLVANLITLSRLEEVENPPELRPFNLSQTALECVDAFTGQAEIAGKTFRAEIAPDLTVLGEETSVGQLISILCDNAVKYAVGDIIVRLYSDSRHVYFETENDWDRSTAPEDIPRLFDRFYRGDKSRAGEAGRSGYGLGLSIARAAAEKNRIRLSAEETKDERLRFRAEFRKQP